MELVLCFRIGGILRNLLLALCLTETEKKYLQLKKEALSCIQGFIRICVIIILHSRRTTSHW